MRADEFIASTPKFLALYDALGIIPPVFVTLPPILAPEGNKKLGKRDGAKDILEYRSEGYLPEAMVNFLAFLGWNPGGEKEIFTTDEIIASFDIAKIHKSGAMFNEEKLLWINKEHIKLQSQENQLQAIKPYFENYPSDLLERLHPAIIDRVSVYGELLEIEKTEFRFFVDRPKFTKSSIQKIQWKDTEATETKKHLEELVLLMNSADFGSVESVKSNIMPYAEIHGRGNVLWPLRMALSGQEKSIDPFTICYVLQKEEVLLRIQEASALLDL